ncbi:hypothetical protein LPW36_04740 [Jinshanibacter sp. LJY008]|uniref:Lyase N-terminal domain-containing protein n=1 Tax=Limnobaculum eriocheiris TaxID=2897391 RepID=A0A9X1MVK6_9GAMM|nr:chondroitinase family protein [Limnobaculum eriocheiris]MCD1125338.1 hypothetical protein [Limnobaculum eriocheiris]
MQPDINERLIDNLEPGGYMYFFEKGVPETITTTDDSALFITNEHSRDGTQSLAWSFKPYAGLIFSQDIGFLDSDDPITPFTFLTWIYCSEPNNEEITFNFGREESVNCSFNIKLNFVGWRGIAVPFRDMEGKAVEGMQYLTISVPDITGTILFDQVIM